MQGRLTRPPWPSLPFDPTSLATLDDPRDMGAAIIAGAAGYVLKQVDSHGLVDAVHRVAAGQRLFGQHPDGRRVDRSSALWP